jgi:hypothetical protein
MTTALAKRRYRLGWRLFKGTVLWARLWLLAGAALTLIASAVLATAIETGMWPVAASVLQWFAAVAASGLLYARLPVWISQGWTRREITVGFAVCGVQASVALAAFVTAGFAAEHAVLALIDQAPGTWGDALASGARYLAVTPIYFFSGALIGVLAARFSGAAWFTAAALVGAALLYTVVLSLEFGVVWFEGALSPAAWTATALALIAALLAAYASTLRTLPIRAKA